MSGMESIQVNGKTYKVQKLGVLETLYLHAEFMHSLGEVVGEVADAIANAFKGKEVEIKEFGASLAKIKPEELKKLQPKIFGQIITPDNRFLGDPMTIEEWFGRPENASDVWEVLVKGGYCLLGEHLPAFLKGMLQKVKKVDPASLPSQTNTPQKQ